MSWLVDPATRALTTSLDGLVRRELTIASNLANIDTPGFKPSSVSFESELAAVAEASAGGPLAMTPPPAGPSVALGAARTSESHLAVIEAAAGASPVATSTVSPDVSMRVDANADDVESQMTSLAETQLKFTATSRMLTGKLQMLKDVVQAR